MPAILPDLNGAGHRNSLDDVRPRMAKALKKRDEDWKDRIGDAVRRCFSLAGVSQKEAAGLLDRDPAQIARWIAATERPQLDALFAVERFRQPLVLALAELAGPQIELETVIRCRRLP